MALLKEIELDNGVIVNYHRIVSINKITNQSNIIEVASYTSEEKRQEELSALENNEPMNVFIETSYISKEYDENETIEDCYDYLKSLDKYKNSEDVQEVRNLENTELVERLVKVEQSDKSAHKRLDEHDAEIKELKETNSILKNMDFRMGNVEEAVDKINIKLDDNTQEKGKKWDKLIDYLFYFILATMLGFIVIKLGLK